MFHLWSCSIAGQVIVDSCKYDMPAFRSHVGRVENQECDDVFVAVSNVDFFSSDATPVMSTKERRLLI